ncbi:winged helix-turn-helix transcriptional regulator [Leucobacter sp. 1207-22]|uniref:winged helix-turn-helix transcriptional regulator n=1 Tax=Leucobacter sp. 1207-22 TaxID=2604456 RepID=UPI004062CA69
MNEELPFDPYNPDCPSRKLMDQIGDRWTVLIIGALAEGPARNSELAETVGGISPRMLSKTLKALERDGLIIRRAYAEVPPRVTYELSESGRNLHPTLLALDSWVRTHMPEVIQARARFDSTAN